MVTPIYKRFTYCILTIAEYDIPLGNISFLRLFFFYYAISCTECIVQSITAIDDNTLFFMHSCKNNYRYFSDRWTLLLTKCKWH